MKTKTSVKTNEKVYKALLAMESQSVLVGIPAGGDTRIATRPGQLTSNATLGYLQETGDPSVNLPARPHLVPGVKAALPRIERIAAYAIRKQTAGDSTAIRKSLDMFGLAAVASVKRTIQARIPPDLADRTKRQRLERLAGYQTASRARKRTMMAKWMTGTFTPLIETSAYISAITYVVRKKP